MERVEIEQRLRKKPSAWAVSDDILDGAIYQDMGINGCDLYELRLTIADLPKVIADGQWSEP